MKWMLVLFNVAAIVVLLGLRQYANGFHKLDAEDAYQGLISRELLDDTKATEYALAHNGWHPKQRLLLIGHPSGLLQPIFVIGVAMCLLNSLAVLYLFQNIRPPRLADHARPSLPEL